MEATDAPRFLNGSSTEAGSEPHVCITMRPDQSLRYWAICSATSLRAVSDVVIKITSTSAARRSFRLRPAAPPTKLAACLARAVFCPATYLIGTPASTSSLPMACPTRPGPTIVTVGSGFVCINLLLVTQLPNQPDQRPRPARYGLTYIAMLAT